MRNGFLQRGNDFYGNNIIKVFCRPVSISSLYAVNQFPHFFVAADFNNFIPKGTVYFGKKAGRDIPVNQKGFSGVTDRNILCFAVGNDFAGHFRISVAIHIYVTDSVRMAKYRDTAVIHNIPDKAVASAGDDQVNQRILLQHLSDILTCFQKLGGIGRETVFLQRAANKAAENLIGMDRFTSAFQQDSISAFNTQG